MEKAHLDAIRTAAAQGNPQAQYVLGGVYFNGAGVPRNPSEGSQWLLRSAENGYAPAQSDIGVLYQKGFGVEQSYGDAMKWYRAAAEQGDILAQHNLGSLNAKGFRLKGTWFFNRNAFAFMKATQDYIEAYKWFTIAANNGHHRSLRDRSIVKRWMIPEQIARAERFAADFLAAHKK
jgi:hypothetical protein